MKVAGFYLAAVKTMDWLCIMEAFDDLYKDMSTCTNAREV